MLVDLHMHTAVSSPCSQIDPQLLIEVASRIGLDAISVTEHEEMEGAEVTRRLGAEAGFPVFRGVEVYTELGDMLVFGLYRPKFPFQTPFAELLSEVREAGGVIVPAHPCRGSLGFHHTLGDERAEFLLANVDATAYGSAEEIPGKLLAQLTGAVRWQQSMEALLADGFDTFYEIGPGKVLAGLMRRIDRKIKVTTINGVEAVQGIV